MTVSVALAAYNGERYIAEQVDSILNQLNENDELIISVNPSNDRTEDIIRDYQLKDKRVKVVICSRKGVLANFENAIRLCSNDIIFLSDQDDIWSSNKIELQLQLFKDTYVGGVCHGCRYIDDSGKPTDEQPRTGKNRRITFWEIIRKNPVQGSTLAFRRELTNYFLPFPIDIPMHDSWIGLCIVKHSNLVYINDQLLFYRQHEGTVTNRHHRKLRQIGRAHV